VSIQDIDYMRHITTEMTTKLIQYASYDLWN